ncbi:ABC transporter ATP-binding protein [Flavobacterium sp.]|jgi:NitT/TauT family transport system ATP-binding protein|uniref:ABC transporter ATP-binding protein n=1 Tax=Flavobacterium sp. TaxID=239 RepID=UPI0037C10A3B
MIVENLQFGYDKKSTIINGVSFSFTEHQHLAIVGASGCGKSTLLRLISGNISPTGVNFLKGSISINGLNPIENIKIGQTSFMFQEPALFPNLTVVENIRFPLKLKNKIDDQWINEVIEKVGLTNYKNYLPSQLSGGMKTRVALARTFITKPKLLLLDEPFGALDVKWKSILYKELEMLREEMNSKIIIVTHDIQEALLLSNNILVMGKEGKIVEQLIIEKKLPRIFSNEDVFELQNEYLKIKKLIIEN